MACRVQRVDGNGGGGGFAVLESDVSVWMRTTVPTYIYKYIYNRTCTYTCTRIYY